MISSTYKILNTTAPCKTFYCTIWSKFPNCLTIRQKTYKTLMKMTPFISHWEEQRHLLVWVGLGRVGKRSCNALSCARWVTHALATGQMFILPPPLCPDTLWWRLCLYKTSRSSQPFDVSKPFELRSLKAFRVSILQRLSSSQSLSGLWS